MKMTMQKTVSMVNDESTLPVDYYITGCNTDVMTRLTGRFRQLSAHIIRLMSAKTYFCPIFITFFIENFFEIDLYRYFSAGF